MKDRVWTISNALSFLRILLVLPIGFFLLSKDESFRWWAAGLMTFAAVTDILDGLLARALKQETELGKIVDPLADKIVVAGIVMILMARGIIPVWFVVVVLGRDVLILAGALYVKAANKVVLQSNAIGKTTVFTIATFTLVSTLNLPALELAETVLLVTSTVLIAFSFLVYVRRFFQVVSGSTAPQG